MYFLGRNMKQNLLYSKLYFNVLGLCGSVIVETGDSEVSLNPTPFWNRRNRMLSLWSSALELMLSAAHRLTGARLSSALSMGLAAGTDGWPWICLLTFKSQGTWVVCLKTHGELLWRSGILTQIVICLKFIIACSLYI